MHGGCAYVRKTSMLTAEEGLLQPAAVGLQSDLVMVTVDRMTSR